MKIPFLILISQISLSVKAQDTLKKSKPAQERYPALKMISLQKDYFGDSDYKLFAKDGTQQGEGEFSGSRFRLTAAIPVYKKNRLSLITGLNYTKQSFTHYEKLENNYYQKHETTKNDFDALFSINYQSSIGNKPLLYSGTVVLGSENVFGVKKMSGLLSASLVLKMQPVTVSTLGIVVILDKSSLFPAFPVFSYWHKISNSDWEIDAIIPQRVILRRSGVFAGWLSAGVELGTHSFFIKQPAEGIFGSGNYEWVSNEVFSNIGYEHLLGKNFVLGIKGGYRNSLSTRLVKVNERLDHYKSRTRIGSSFFAINMGFVLPNSHLKKARQTKK